MQHRLIVARTGMFAMMTYHCYTLVLDRPDLKIGVQKVRNPQPLIHLHVCVYFMDLSLLHSEPAKL